MNVQRMLAGFEALARMRDAFEPAPKPTREIEMREVAPGVFASAPERKQRRSYFHKLATDLGELGAMRDRIQAQFGDVERGLRDRRKR